MASTQFVERGRNFSRGVLFARPSLKKAIDLSALVDASFDVVKLSSYPSDDSYIVTTPGASGQGSYEGTKTLLRFIGWEPIVVMTRKEFDNRGANFEGCPSTLRRFEWTFVDLNNDRVLDLVETRIDEKKDLPDCQLKSLKTTRRYLNSFPEFVPMEPDSLGKD